MIKQWYLGYDKRCMGENEGGIPLTPRDIERSANSFSGAEAAKRQEGNESPKNPNEKFLEDTRDRMNGKVEGEEFNPGQDLVRFFDVLIDVVKNDDNPDVGNAIKDFEKMKDTAATIAATLPVENTDDLLALHAYIRGLREEFLIPGVTSAEVMMKTAKEKELPADHIKKIEGEKTNADDNLKIFNAFQKVIDDAMEKQGIPIPEDSKKEAPVLAQPTLPNFGDIENTPTQAANMLAARQRGITRKSQMTAA